MAPAGQLSGMKLLFVLALLATGTLGVIHIIAGSFTWLGVFAPLLFVAGLWLALLIFKLTIAFIFVMIALVVLHRHSGLSWTDSANRLQQRTTTGDPKTPLRRLFHD